MPDLSLSERINRQKNNSPNEIIKRRIILDYTDCPHCEGSLYLPNGKPCQCRKDFIIGNKLKKCGVGTGYIYVDMKFYKKRLAGMEVQVQHGLLGPSGGKLKIHEFIEFIELYIDTFDNRLYDGHGFILSGMTGCGKTSATVYIIRELCKTKYAKARKPSIKFIDMLTVLDTIKDTWDDDSDTRKESKQLIKDLSEFDLLVLDDLGAEYTKSKDWVVSILLSVIKKRLNNNRPTIITTNLKLSELSKNFSTDEHGRLASVLSEKFDVLSIVKTSDVRARRSNDLFKSMKKEIDYE